jgi:predicted DNA-binding protein (MmcQ/YjbR family)
MRLDVVRSFCRGLPHVTEDVKWGHDLCFSIGGKMFCVVDLEPPHSIAFKCTPEAFADLVERQGIVPAPYMARNLWVQEQPLGDALERRELEALVTTSYNLVLAKLPKRMQAALSGERRDGRRSRNGPGVWRRRPR